MAIDVACAEDRLLRAEQLAAFLTLFARAMAAAAFGNGGEVLVGGQHDEYAWDGVGQVADTIYEHLRAVHDAGVGLHAPAPDHQEKQ